MISSKISDKAAHNYELKIWQILMRSKHQPEIYGLEFNDLIGFLGGCRGLSPEILGKIDSVYESLPATDGISRRRKK